MIFHEMSFAQLTPEEIAELQSKVDTLEPMNMALFNQMFKLIDENYPLTFTPLGYIRRSNSIWHLHTNQNKFNSLVLSET